MHAHAHTLRAQDPLVRCTRCGIAFVGDNPISDTGEPGLVWGMLSASAVEHMQSSRSHQVKSIRWVSTPIKTSRVKGVLVLLIFVELNSAAHE